jgi:hypothetical protein
VLGGVAVAAFNGMNPSIIPSVPPDAAGKPRRQLMCSRIAEEGQGVEWKFGEIRKK